MYARKDIFRLVSILLLVFYFSTPGNSAAVAHYQHHRHQNNHAHQALHERELQSIHQAKQHMQGAHARHREHERSRLRSSPTPTTQLYIAGYIVNPTKLVMIPVAESKEVREAMNEKNQGGMVPVEAVLFLKDADNIRLEKLEVGDLEKVHGEKEHHQERSSLAPEGLRVAKGGKKEAKYWLMVWLMPALMLGVVLQEREA